VAEELVDPATELMAGESATGDPAGVAVVVGEG
jgi:hypothetical protein